MGSQYLKSVKVSVRKKKIRMNKISLLFLIVCTMSLLTATEGKCTGERLRKYNDVHNCKVRGGKCCSRDKTGNSVTWSGQANVQGYCGWCWSGRNSFLGSDGN